MPPSEIARERERTERGALYPTHESALTLKKLTNLLTTRTHRGEAVPAVAAFGLELGALNVDHLESAAVIELTLTQSFDLCFVEFAAHTYQKLDRPSAHHALQALRELAVGGEKFQAAIDPRHR